MADDRHRPERVPWFIWCVVVAVTSAIVGGHWDISWHRSIGRDTFWTAPHMAIYLCGVLGGLSSAWLILSTTFGRDREARAAAVGLWGFRGPLGAFVIAWGGIAMLTSAPFDDWWHAAYGLDVKIISPPHTLLVFGMFMVQLGALLLIGGYMNRAQAPTLRRRYAQLFIYLGALVLVLVTLFIMERTGRTQQHTAEMYRTVALAMPLSLIGISRAAPQRWAATLMAAVYTLFMLAMIWILPLFHAEPKLGPVYHPVTRFVPPEFPLLVIVPAFALDLWRASSEPSEAPPPTGLGAWKQAAALGAIFLALLVLAQWPFAWFLQSPYARNAVVGSHYAGYYERPGSLHALYQFADGGSPAHFWSTMASALLAAIVMSRLGLGLGNWLRRIKR